MDRTILSLKEARKIINNSSKMITNEELSALIDDTETVVRLIIRLYLRSKNVKLV